MIRFSAFLLASLFIWSCSSDDVPDQDDRALLTVTRGPNSYLSPTLDIKNLSIEVIITGEDGEVLSKKIIEANEEVVFKAKYDTNRTYDMHFVYRYITSELEPESVNSNVLSYFIQTFLNVSNRSYFFDLDKEENFITSGMATLQLNNIPSSSITTNISNGKGSDILTNSIFGGTATRDVNVKSNGTTSIYAHGIIDNRENLMTESKFVQLDMNDGDEIILNYSDLKNTTKVNMSFPTLETIDSDFRNFITQISGFDEPIHEGYYTLDADIILRGDNYFELDFDIPEDAFENYSVNAVIVKDNFLRTTRNIYKNVSEIPSSLELSSLTAKILDDSFFTFKAEITGEYDYYKISSYFSNEATATSPAQIFGWVVYNESDAVVSLNLKNSVVDFINEEDNFDLEISALKARELEIMDSPQINNKEDATDMLINRNRSTNLRNISYENWRSRNLGSRTKANNISEDNTIDLYHSNFNY